MFDRRLVQYFYWGLLGTVFLAGSLGLIVLYSAVRAGPFSHNEILFSKQLIWFGAGLVVMVASFMFNYKKLDRWSYLIYCGCIVLLICVFIFGKQFGGSRRWLTIGQISIQPSEFVKIGIIICIARYYSKRINSKGLTLRQLFIPLILTAIPFVLILKQPDLGTAMLIVLIVGSMTVFAKIERHSFIYILISGVVVTPLVWFFLRGYQKQRLLTFLSPDRDPLGAGYHIIQSKIAIGSGMMFGKGFLKGTQNALSFLPEQHTDFIFSVLAEEWGFIGSIIIFLVFLMLIACSLNVAYGCRDPFGIMISVGITIMISWQVFINIGMVMGLMPIVGVTLPLVSYGGSSIITMMVSIGILMNIGMRRFMFE